MAKAACFCPVGAPPSQRLARGLGCWAGGRAQGQIGPGRRRRCGHRPHRRTGRRARAGPLGGRPRRDFAFVEHVGLPVGKGSTIRVQVGQTGCRRFCGFLAYREFSVRFKLLAEICTRRSARRSVRRSARGAGFRALVNVACGAGGLKSLPTHARARAHTHARAQAHASQARTHLARSRARARARANTQVHARARTCSRLAMQNPSLCCKFCCVSHFCLNLNFYSTEQWNGLWTLPDSRHILLADQSAATLTAGFWARRRISHHIVTLQDGGKRLGI